MQEGSVTCHSNLDLWPINKLVLSGNIWLSCPFLLFYTELESFREKVNVSVIVLSCIKPLHSKKCSRKIGTGSCVKTFWCPSIGNHQLPGNTFISFCAGRLWIIYLTLPLPLSPHVPFVPFLPVFQLFLPATHTHTLIPRAISEKKMFDGLPPLSPTPLIQNKESFIKSHGKKYDME